MNLQGAENNVISQYMKIGEIPTQQWQNQTLFTSKAEGGFAE